MTWSPCIDNRPSHPDGVERWTCDGEWHRGWSGHDPWVARCPRPRPPAPAARERPILFSAPMVRALLDGRKAQTRRIVKPQPPAEAQDAGVIGSATESNGAWWWLDSADLEWASPIGEEFRCPYGVPGDLLWVRETLKRAPHLWTYAADGAEVGWPARQGLAGKSRDTVVSIHMPRDACRLRLQITDVRVERLHQISEADAIAEGYPADCVWTPNVWYAQLWASINGPGSWDANPWVWAVSFERVRS